jgi:hypothetical protein
MAFATWCMHVCCERTHCCLWLCHVGFSVAPALVSSNTPSELFPSRSIMPAKEEYKAKPSSKSEKNKPKGGAAKDAEREKKKAKDAEKALRK